MIITQEQLNQVLDNYFTMSDAHIFNQQYFDHSMQLILDNHHDLYDMMRSTGDSIALLAFEVLRRFAQEACDNEYGDVEYITNSMLVRWAWTKDETDTYSLAIMDNTINYITNERAEAQKEKEESTMKTINPASIDNNTINNAGDIVCPISGEVLITAEGVEVAAYTEINGVLYSDDIVDDYFTTCAECGEYVPNDEAVEVDGEYFCKDCIEEHFVQCAHCGEYVSRDDATYADGEYYCDDCRCDYLFYCEECGEYHDEDNIHYIEDKDIYVCDDCLERYFTECEHCGRYYQNSNVDTVIVNDRGRTEEWCRNCREDNTWCCDECGETYSYDVDYEERGYDYICPDCRGERAQDTGDINTWRSPRYREDYYFKPAPCLCATDAEREKAGADWRRNIVFYGFENEIDRREKCNAENEWSAKIVDKLFSTYCKKDCSLDKGGSYSGIEIVSHPATLAWYEEHKSDFEACFDMLKDGGWLSHDAGTCGLHVHISLRALEMANPYAVNNMLYLVDRFWDNLVKFSRRTESQLNNWARRYSTARGTYEEIKNMAKRECDRYMAVNLKNEHTVELRIFRGTLNLETFFATLQMVDVLVNRCIEIGSDVRRLQSISWEEFVASDHAELKSYLARRGLLEGSVEQPEPPEEQEAEPMPTSRCGFNVGDHVTVDLQHNASRIVPEYLSHGVVMGFSNDHDSIAVMFDSVRSLANDYNVWMHSCDNLCPGMSGRWCDPGELILD